MEAKDLVLLMLIPVILISMIVYVDKSPAITGAVALPQEENNIIGNYKIMPSFRAKIDYNMEDYKNIKAELDKIIDGCKNNPDIEKCLKEAKPEWNCMPPKDAASAILSSFTDQYKECINLKEEGVVCKFTLEKNKDITKNKPERNFEIILSKGYGGLKAELKEKNIPIPLATEDINTENLFYTGYDNKDEKGTEVESATIKIIYADGKPIVDIVYATTSQSEKIYLSNFQNIPEQLLFFYKNKHGINFIDLNERDSFRTGKIITLPRAKGVKFCAKSPGGKQIYAYDDSDKTVKLRDIIYRFAVTFPIPIPKPVENLEVIDAPKAENSVILKWDKPEESNIKSYSIYYSKKDFLNAKIDDIKKDSNIYKKSVLNNPIEIGDIDLGNCIINPVGAPCKYILYNNPLEKNRLYYLTGENKLIYVLSDQINLKDGEEYNFAVTAVNEADQELDNDKSIQNNLYTLAENKNYRKAMPIDDLPPNSENLIEQRIQQSYDSASKKVTFNFAELPRTNADGSPINDFKNYRIYHIMKYGPLTPRQKAEVVSDIMNNKLNSIILIKYVDYSQTDQKFSVDLASTNLEIGNTYFFIVVAQDKSGNPKEDEYRVKELGAVPLQLTI